MAPALNEPPQVEIRPFRPADHEAVVALYRDSMMRYTNESHPHYPVWVDYVSHTLATDLADISSHYLSKEGANFFVATMQTDDADEPIVVATLAIERKSETVAELRRVAVDASHRRAGIGRMLMRHTTEWAKTNKYDKLVLSNAATQDLAHKFYTSLGYTLTKTSVHCEDPYFELTHFEKEI
ncbi:Gcn5-related n-acetyltransferase-like protein, partial [Globisporangium splendens]